MQRPFPYPPTEKLFSGCIIKGSCHATRGPETPPPSQISVGKWVLENFRPLLPRRLAHAPIVFSQVGRFCSCAAYDTVQLQYTIILHDAIHCTAVPVPAFINPHNSPCYYPVPVAVMCSMQTLQMQTAVRLSAGVIAPV